MLVRTLAVLLAILSTVSAAASVKDRWVDLFNGTDLTGWTVGGSPWIVDGSLLRNTQGRDADWIRYNTPLPEDQFAFEVRVRVVDGNRFRAHVAFDSIYIGNEGTIRQFEVYGADISNVRQVGNDTYVTGQWYTLRLEVDSADNVRFFKDGVLTHTATRSRRVPSQITILAGDGSSEGHVELSSIRYWRLPQPVVADSVADFAGTQGHRNWYYGFYDGPFTSSGFKSMLVFDPAFGPPGTWLVDYANYWTAITRSRMHPNGPMGADKLPTEHWAVRRWLSTVEGTASISGYFSHYEWDDPNSACGDGATAHILVDGSEVWAQWVSGTDVVGLFYSIDTVCHAGSVIDFVLSPGANELCDHFVFTSLIAPSEEPTADLWLTKSGSPDPVCVGSSLTYSLVATNCGPDAATSVVLTDHLPAAVAFVSATASQGDCSETDGVVMVDLGHIPNGGSATLTIVVTPSSPGTITNIATVTAAEHLPDPSHSTVSIDTRVIQEPLSPLPVVDHYEQYILQRGWYDDKVAWYACLTTNDLSYASSGSWLDSWSPLMISPPTLSAMLTSAVVGGADSAARPLYVVANSQQGPVFTSRPGDDDYSGLWRIWRVRWHAGRARPITNANPSSPLNPTGLPDASDADIVETGAVLDCPILAIGPLSGPWHSTTADYRIPQAKDYGATGWLKWIRLPHFRTFAQAGGMPLNADLLIADVGSRSLARALGANYAPALSRVPPGGTCNFWIMNQPKPPAQLPLISTVPGESELRTNPEYSPVMNYVVLDRLVPQFCVVSTYSQLAGLLDNGLLTVTRRDQRVKAHVVPKR